jgi:hypothetical protein
METTLLMGLVVLLFLVVIFSPMRPRFPHYNQYEYKFRSPRIIDYFNYSGRPDFHHDPNWEEYQQSIRSLDPYAYIIGLFVLLFFLLTKLL